MAMKAVKKAKKKYGQFKAGYEAGKHPTKHKLSRAFDTASNIAGAALTGGPIGAAATIGFTAMQVREMNKVGSKAGRLGRKVGGKVLSAKQKLALKRAQLASAVKRRKR
jgi:hypothetical protein